VGTAAQYESYAMGSNFMIDLNLDSIAGCASSDTGRAWVGQRSDPFWISLGRIFDYLNMIPVQLPAFNSLTIAQCATNNDLREKNVDVIALEVPIGCVTTTTPSNGIIYVWAGTRLLYHAVDDLLGNTHIAGPQVSRMGNPLVNELVIGLIDKDRFSRQHPAFDADPVIGFGNYVFYPTLPAVINTRYRAAVNSVLGANIANLAPTTPRVDLVATFLTGIPGLNKASGFVGEVLRLNLAIPPVPWGQQNPLGVVGSFLYTNGSITSDLAGFPNGRRPGDDVVDIALDVMMGALCVPAFVSNGFALCNGTNSFPIGGIKLTDGSPVQDINYGKTFPYINTPTPGSYVDGAVGSIVTDATKCYPASQHGRCALGSATPSTVPSSASNTPGQTVRCSSAGRIEGLVLSLLNLF